MATRRKKTVEENPTEHLKFGSNLYVVSKVGELFWAICPALGDAGTYSGLSREDLIAKLIKDTGAQPVVATPAILRTVLFEEYGAKMYSDGVIDLVTPYARIKIEAKYRMTYKGKWKTDFDNLFRGCDLTSFDDLEDGDCECIQFQVTKARYFHANGVQEDVDYTDLSLTSSGYYKVDSWLTPLMDHLHEEDPVSINAFSRMVNSSHEDIRESNPSPDERSLLRYILVIKGLLHIEEHNAAEWEETIWVGDDTSTVQEFETTIDNIKKLAIALEMA